MKIKLLGRFFERAPNRAFLAVALGVLAGAVYAMVIPLVLNAVTMDTSGYETLTTESIRLSTWEISHYRFAAVFAVGCTLVLVARTASQLILTHIALDLATDFRVEIYKRISSAPIAELERMGLSRLVASITTDVPALIQGARLLPDLLTSGTTLIGMLAYLAYLNWAVFNFVLICIVFGVVTYQLPMIFARKFLVRARGNMDNLHESIRGLVHGAKELKLNRDKAHEYFSDVLLENETSVRTDGKKANTIMRVTQSYGDAISLFLLGAVTFVFANHNSITKEELTGVIMALLYVTGPVVALMNCIPQYVGANVSLTRVNELFGKMSQENVDINCEERRDWSVVRFSGVRYQYPAADAEAGFSVGPLSFEIKKGEITFIVGGNGSGKSTVSKMISLHYRPCEGEIAFDDVPLDASNIAGYRRTIAAIYSDYHLFERVLGAGDRDVSQDVEFYLAAMALKGKVSFENGRFSTLSLSDGQRRRLALLSAYLEDAELYLFDEWAADQDPAFKKVFYHRILPELKARGKAVVAITHDDRFFSIADRLLVMDEGTLISTDHILGATTFNEGHVQPGAAVHSDVVA